MNLVNYGGLSLTEIVQKYHSTMKRTLFFKYFRSKWQIQD